MDSVSDTVIDTSDTEDSATLPASITHHCCAAVMPTQIEGQIYNDQTGRFPVTSTRVHSQIFVLYDYDSNSIHAQAMQSKTAAKILKAFKTIHNNLVLAILIPQLQRLDNE
jgi:hypothetical protein